MRSNVWSNERFGSVSCPYSCTTVVPNLSDTGAYRLKSETVLTNPLNEQLDLEIKFIDEFESDPAGDSKKNDARFISSLVYSF